MTLGFGGGAGNAPVSGKTGEDFIPSRICSCTRNSAPSNSAACGFRSAKLTKRHRRGKHRAKTNTSARTETHSMLAAHAITAIEIDAQMRTMDTLPTTPPRNFTFEMPSKSWLRSTLIGDSGIGVDVVQPEMKQDESKTSYGNNAKDIGRLGAAPLFGVFGAGQVLSSIWWCLFVAWLFVFILWAKYYTSATEFNCGIDVHAHQMYVCVMDKQGKKLVHTNIKDNDFQYFLKLVKPYQHSLTVCCECMFGWYWLADACQQAGLTFVLAHALYVKAIHGGKNKNDRIDSEKLTHLLHSNLIPPAYVYPAKGRPARALLRQRILYVQNRAELLARIHSHQLAHNRVPARQTGLRLARLSPNRCLAGLQVRAA